MSNIVSAKASDFAQAILSLKGRQLSFDSYKHWRLVYDVSPELMVLIAGRQIGKSVSLSGRSVTQSISRKFFNTLYVAPFQTQTTRFSHAYMDPFIASPLIRKYFKNKAAVKNVYEKGFSTGSTVYLSYAQDEADADRIRGIMADQLLIDEVQDIMYSALPPIFEVTSASEHAFKVMSGTAKSTTNTLEFLWQDTCKFEWVVRCPHCNYWNIPDTFEACLRICELPQGPSCMKCRKIIDMSQGRWVATKPSERSKIGFHLPQFIMTANTSQKKWPRLNEKVMQAQNFGLYSPAKLANEVFGISTDLAGKALSVSECMACCNPDITAFHEKTPFRQSRYTHVIMGVDWSVTGSELSYTVASVFGFNNDGKMELIYAEKFQGINILVQIDRIGDLFMQYECDIIAADRGMGVVQVQTLQRRFGFKKVVPINYVSAKVSVRWDQQGLFIAADRTRALDSVIMKIRLGRDRFETPSYNLTKGFWMDALEVYEEETSVGTRVYRHHPEMPDDWIHSAAFAYIGYQYMTGDFTFTDEENPRTSVDDMFAYELPSNNTKGYEDV